jgi:hypothetical protein
VNDSLNYERLRICFEWGASSGRIPHNPLALWRVAMRAIGLTGQSPLLFDAGSLKPRFDRPNAGIDLFLRQLTEQ